MTRLAAASAVLLALVLVGATTFAEGASRKMSKPDGAPKGGQPIDCKKDPTADACIEHCFLFFCSQGSGGFYTWAPPGTSKPYELTDESKAPPGIPA